MHIRHERPMSDLAFEVRAPLALTLADGTDITVPAWSLDGFTYPHEIDVLPREAVLSIPFQGVDIRFPVTLIQTPGTRHLRFDGLTGRQRETLAVFYRSLLNGRMAATDEIITALDTPVDLVPMGETEEEKSAGEAKSAPRLLRAAISIAMHLLLAGLVFWTLGAGIYGKLATVEIRNARIEAPLLPRTAPAKGYVKQIAVAPGDHVAAGDILVRLATQEGEAALADVRARINLIEARIAEAQARLDLLRARIAEARAALLARLSAGPDETAVALLAALAAFDAGLDASVADLRTAEAATLREIDSLTEELRQLRRERGRWRAATDALILRADVAGTITEVHVTRGQFVGRDAPMLDMEAAEARTARGWVDQSLRGLMRPGMVVQVAVQSPEGTETLRGEVAEVVAGIDRTLSSEFGLLVTVRFPELDMQATRETLPHLLPVSLEAERVWATKLSTQLRDLRAAIGL